MAFDESTASPEELWTYYTGKYNNPNPIAKMLTDGFFNKLKELVSSLPVDNKILEVGCGPGISTRRIHGMLHGQYLEASEFEQRLVDLLASKNFPVKLSQESVYEMQRTDNEFDCVLLLEVLEHLEEPEQALQEIFRVASKTVIVSVPREPLWCTLNFLRGKYIKDWGNTPGHINHWSKQQFIALLNNFGQVTHVHSPIPWTILKVSVDS